MNTKKEKWPNIGLYVGSSLEGLRCGKSIIIMIERNLGK
jgi:hypothetical protein